MARHVYEYFLGRWLYHHRIIGVGIHEQLQLPSRCYTRHLHTSREHGLALSPFCLWQFGSRHERPPPRSHQNEANSQMANQPEQR